MAKFLKKSWEYTFKLLYNAGSSILLIMFLSTIVQVFFRYVLNNPLPWPEEIARYCFIWITFIGLAINVKSDEHYRIDFILNRLNPKYRNIIELFFNVVTILFLIIAIIGSRKLISGNWHILSANKISVNLVYLSLPIMSVVIIIQLVINTFIRMKCFNHEGLGGEIK
jgi:TRAP-type C4-dicarboxylate transport system permease small subunit